VRTIQDGSGDVAAGGLWRIAVSPDNKNVYSANYDDSSVGIFKRSK
jgi:DNA-binding beta-propeller fold protein YncE